MYVGVGDIPLNSGRCDGVPQGAECAGWTACRCLDLSDPTIMAEVKKLIRAYAQIPMSTSSMWTLLDEANYAAWVDRTESAWSGPTEEDLARQTGSQWVYPAARAIEIMLQEQKCLTPSPSPSSAGDHPWQGCAAHPVISRFFAETMSVGERTPVDVIAPIIGSGSPSESLPGPVEIEEVVIQEASPRQARATGVILIGSLVAGLAALAAVTK